MTYPAVFAAGRGAPFTDEFQDMIREHMLARLPPVPEPKPERKPYQLSDDRFRRRRERMEPFIVEQREKGNSIAIIARNFGISQGTVTRILKEREARGAPPTVLPPLIAPPRLCGRIDKWHTSRSDDRDEWLANARGMGYSTAQMAQALSISPSAVVRAFAKMEAA